MTSLPHLIARLIANPLAEPWVRFCAQCIDRNRPCVLVTVLDAPPQGPCETGEHFVYDGDGHGLLPRDMGFSVSLHRLTQEALVKGPLAEALTPSPRGPVRVSLVPFVGVCSQMQG